MRPLRRLAIRGLSPLVLAAVVCVGCARVEGDDIGTPIFNGTTPDGIAIDPPITTLPAPEIDAIRVPFDHFSLQEAVDAAQPGDLILIDPGVYSEEVVVTTPDIVIRGRDRNSVFVDGLHSAASGIRVLADGVAIENMTIRNYTEDAIHVGGATQPTPVDGFRALHVTTSNTGRHGIATTNANNVEIREVWASGAGGGGVSIEACTTCSTLIETTLSEFSARGISIVGATDDVAILRSTSRNNRVGIVVEDGPAQSSRGVVVAGSVVVNNGFATTPRFEGSWDSGFGVGIQLGGTVGVRLQANRVTGNTRAGIVLSQSLNGSNGDAVGPTIVGNAVTGHPEGDIVFAFGESVIDPQRCLDDNADAVVLPIGADLAATCGRSEVASPLFEWTGQERSTIPYENGPVPPGIEGLADADSSVPAPAGPVQIPPLSGVVLPTV